MKKEWYIFLNSSHIGPYSLMEMKAFFDKRDIKENTLVWKEGMVEWLPLKKLDLFKGAIPSKIFGNTDPDDLSARPARVP